MLELRNSCTDLYLFIFKRFLEMKLIEREIEQENIPFFVAFRCWGQMCWVCAVRSVAWFC